MVKWYNIIENKIPVSAIAWQPSAQLDNVYPEFE